MIMLAACGGGSSESLDAAVTPDAAGSPDYARLFPDDRVLDVDLAIADADWARLLADPLNDALQIPATLTYDGIVVTDVGVETKGNSSRNSVMAMGSERYSLKLDLDDLVPGQDLLGVDKLNLHNSFKDPTLLRETIGYALMRGAGVPASRTAFARLTINGELHGLYVVVEQVEADFLRDRFADTTGDLLKPEPPSGSLMWRGDTFADYPEIEAKTNEDDPVHQRFIDLVTALDRGTDAEVEALLDLDTLVRWLAVNTYLVNLDSYAGSAHNYYLFDDRSTGLWTLIPWDLNETFGNFRCAYTPEQVLALDHLAPVCGPLDSRPLVARVLAMTAWRTAYQGYLAELIAGAGAPAAILADVDVRAAMIRPVVAEDPTAFFTVDQFDTAIHDDLTVAGVPGTIGVVLGLATFAERRAAAVTDQLP